MPIRVVALAGGVGAGKFLRGLVRAVRPDDVTVVINTGDDIDVHGLRVSPDLDSVTYWLAGIADRERGWGRAGETFRATAALRELGAPDAWFCLGDLDLATHLFRTRLLRDGSRLSEVTAEIGRRLAVAAHLIPMSDDRVTTRIQGLDVDGHALDLHFQEYWVRRGARDTVQDVRFDGGDTARPAPGVIEAIEAADAVLLCPSNPVVSIDPILAVDGIEAAVRDAHERAVGVSPIVGGVPLRGMADRLLPSRGVEVSAAGVGSYYAARGLISGWVIDEVDRASAETTRAAGIRVAVTDTVMVDDAAAESLARTTLDLALVGASA